MGPKASAALSTKNRRQEPSVVNGTVFVPGLDAPRGLLETRRARVVPIVRHLLLNETGFIHKTLPTLQPAMQGRDNYFLRQLQPFSGETSPLRPRCYETLIWRITGAPISIADSFGGHVGKTIRTGQIQNHQQNRQPRNQQQQPRYQCLAPLHAEIASFYLNGQCNEHRFSCRNTGLSPSANQRQCDRLTHLELNSASLGQQIGGNPPRRGISALAKPFLAAAAPSRISTGIQRNHLNGNIAALNNTMPRAVHFGSSAVASRGMESQRASAPICSSRLQQRTPQQLNQWPQQNHEQQQQRPKKPQQQSKLNDRRCEDAMRPVTNIGVYPESSRPNRHRQHNKNNHEPPNQSTRPTESVQACPAWHSAKTVAGEHHGSRIYKAGRAFEEHTTYDKNDCSSRNSPFDTWPDYSVLSPNLPERAFPPDTAMNFVNARSLVTVPQRYAMPIDCRAPPSESRRCALSALASAASSISKREGNGNGNGNSSDDFCMDASCILIGSPGTNVPPSATLHVRPRNRIRVRPPLPYPMMIAQALLQAPGNRLTQFQLHEALAQMYPDCYGSHVLTTNSSSWKNTLRFYLSQSPIFEQVPHHLATEVDASVVLSLPLPPSRGPGRRQAYWRLKRCWEDLVRQRGIGVLAEAGRERKSRHKRFGRANEIWPVEANSASVGNLFV